jgi:competence protein ComEC
LVNAARSFGLLVSAAGLAVACSSSPALDLDHGNDELHVKATAEIAARSASAVADVPRGAPSANAYRVQLLDVGTGLSVLVQGHDFTMLYDAGSNDDAHTISPNVQTAALGNQSRLLAYLFASVGPSGGPECVPQGDNRPPGASPKRVIDHLFLSHAHLDHVSMMADVLHCYDVKNVWEPGAVYDEGAYASFVQAVAASAATGVHYHTAAAPGRALAGKPVPAGFVWSQFAENDTLGLGEGATLKILHADGAVYPGDVNRNSTVVHLTLGSHTALLVGDAEAGDRDAPMSPVGDIEAELLANHRSELAVDILQIGHHGSSTSSRSSFVSAVFPGSGARYALLSAGPRPYSGVTLPDTSVVSEYEALAPSGVQLLRTDTHDEMGCPTKDRVGMDDDSPGGCDNYVLDL